MFSIDNRDIEVARGIFDFWNVKSLDNNRIKLSQSVVAEEQN